MVDKRKKSPSGGKAKEDTFFVKCIHCGRELSTNNGNFYRANEKTLFTGNKDNDGVNWLPVCKACIKDEIYVPYLHDTKDYYRAVYLTCRKLDILYTHDLANTALERAKGDNGKAIGYVFGLLGSLHQYSTHFHNFDDSETIAMDDKEEFQKELDKIKNKSKLTPDDKKNIRDIKRILSYDPFVNTGLSEMQLKNVYSDLVGYLSFSDEIATSPLQLSTVLEMIHISSQIRDLDLYISIANNTMQNSQDNQPQINMWMTQKVKLIDAKNKILKENKSWLSESGSNKNKLGVLMKKYRDLGFDEVETNYFDVATSEAIKTVMDLSHRSIADTLDFGDEEAKEVLMIQRDRIKELEEEIAKADKDKREVAMELVELKKQLQDK